VDLLKPSNMSQTGPDSPNDTDKRPKVMEKDTAPNASTSNEPVLENLRRNLQFGLQTAREGIEKGIEDARRNLTEGYYSARKDINSGIDDARRNIGEGVESARTNLASGLETARVGINSGLVSAQESLGGTSSVSTTGTRATITRPVEYADEKGVVQESEASPRYESLEQSLDWRSGAEGQESGVVPPNEK